MLLLSSLTVGEFPEYSIDLHEKNSQIIVWEQPKGWNISFKKIRDFSERVGSIVSTMSKGLLKRRIFS